MNTVSVFQMNLTECNVIPNAITRFKISIPPPVSVFLCTIKQSKYTETHLFSEKKNIAVSFFDTSLKKTD